VDVQRYGLDRLGVVWLAVPLNVTIFAEGDQTFPAASPPRTQREFLPGPRLKSLFQRGEKT
jgi:hypothetical protein